MTHLDAVDGTAVKTVILVSPSRGRSDPAWGFVDAHVDALDKLVERVVVLTPPDGDGVPLPQQLDTSLDSSRALDHSGGGPTVVVLDDPSLLAQVRAALGDRAPVLWWVSQAATPSSCAAGSRWADGMVALVQPECDTDVPTWVVGAGVDLVDDPPEMPPRLPLQLLALGRTAPSKGLTAVIRAVAIARSNGIDTRLRIVGPSTNAVETCYRRELERLVRDIALGGVVTVEGAVEPSAVVATITQAHALIDASIDDDLRRAPFEAIAAGRPVLTSNRWLASMFEGEQVMLDFAPGDPAELARRIGLLTDLWPTNLAQLASVAQAHIRPEHTRPVLAAQWAEAIAGVRAHVARRATRSTPAPDPAAVSNDALVTDAIARDLANTATQFLDAWAALDPDRALTWCAPGAVRHATTPDGVGGGAGAPAADYLYWAALVTQQLDSTVEELEVIDDTSVVAVRRDRWQIGDVELEVVVRSLFELADDLIVSWFDTELAPAGPTTSPVITAPTAASAVETMSAPPASSSLVVPPIAPMPSAPGEPPTATATDVPTATTPATGPPTTPVVAPATDPASPAERVERAEEQAHHWRRQALIWRERALEARALGEAYKSNVEDLRVIVEVLKRQAVLAAQAAERSDAAAGTDELEGDAGSDGDVRSISWTADEHPTTEVAAGDDAAVTPPPTRAEPSEPSAPSAPEPYRTWPTPARRSSLDIFLARSTELARRFSRSFGKR